MNAHTFTLENGRKVSVEDPNGGSWTRDQAREYLRQQLASKKSREMSHPPERLSERDQLRMSFGQAFGVPPQQIDFDQGNAGFWDRLKAGFLSDNPEEAQAFLENQYPGAKIVNKSNTFGVQLPDGKIVFPNPPGFEPVGSTAEFAGRVGPGVLGGTVGATLGAGGGMLGAFGGGAAGVAGAEATREAAQVAAGTQRENAWELGRRVGTDVALEGIPLAGRTVKAMTRAIRNRGGREINEFLDKVSTDELVKFIKWARDNDVTIPNLLNLQRSADPVLSKAASQALQFSSKGQLRLVAQMNEFARGIREAGPQVPAGRSPDDIIQAQEAERYAAEKSRFGGDPVSAQREGENMAASVETTRKSRKQAMKDQWSRVETLVNDWNPRYDMSGAQQAARQRQVEGILPLGPKEEGWVLQRPKVTGGNQVARPGYEGEYETLGPVEVREYMGKIKINPDPQRKLAQINDLIARLDPVQDFAAIKELRSQVGQLLEMPRARLLEGGVDVAQAQKIYGELSDTMMDPQGVIPGAAEGIRRQTKEANRLSRDYYHMYDLPPVEQALSAVEKGTEVELYNNMVRNPGRFSERFRQVLDEGDVHQQQRLRVAMERSILQSDDPLKTLERWQKDNLDAYNWMFPTATAKSRAKMNAARLRDLEKSVSKEAEDAAFEKVGFAMAALDDHMGKRFVRGSDATRQAKEVLRREGGTGSEGHLALRQAIWMRTLDSAMKKHEATENLVLDPKKIRDAIDDLKTSGSWDGILTKRDRTLLEGAYKYAKRVYRKGDAGTGLTVASQVGQVRMGNPAAIVNVYTSRRMADWLTRESLPGEALFRSIGKSRGSWLGSEAAQNVLGALARSYGQGTAATVFNQENQSSMPPRATEPPQLQESPPGL